MVVPSIPNGFRAIVSAIQSLDERQVVSFNNYSLPEDWCASLLMKNLGNRILESVVREEFESLNLRVQEVMQLRFGRQNQDPAKDRTPNPSSLY
jgi:hypothetical protein